MRKDDQISTTAQSTIETIVPGKGLSTGLLLGCAIVSGLSTFIVSKGLFAVGAYDLGIVVASVVAVFVGMCCSLVLSIIAGLLNLLARTTASSRVAIVIPVVNILLLFFALFATIDFGADSFVAGSMQLQAGLAMACGLLGVAAAYTLRVRAMAENMADTLLDDELPLAEALEEAGEQSSDPASKRRSWQATRTRRADRVARRRRRRTDLQVTGHPKAPPD